MSDGSPPPSICFIRAAESYPKSQMEKEDSQLFVPFQELAGESIKFLGRTDDGVLALSNYRIFLSKKSTTSETYVPLGLIESVQARDLFHLVVNCKDASTVRCSFPSAEQCSDWQRRIQLLIGVPETLETLFAFPFYSWMCDMAANKERSSSHALNGHHNGSKLAADCDYSNRLQRAIQYESDFKHEVARLGFDLKGSWRISTANSDFKLCPTYPQKLLVPCCITDEMLHNVANFRGSRRLPAVVWRHQKSGAILARCSQPEVGWLGWRNYKDEELLKALADACAFDRGEHARRTAPTTTTTSQSQQNQSQQQSKDNKDTTNGGQTSSSGKSSPSLEDSSHEELALDEIRKILIVDARSYTSAVTNRARGGGCECIEYYPCAEIEFMNLGNIHAIRKSFHAVRQLCASSPDDPNWLGQLEKTMWMQHLAGLLGAAMTVVHTIEKKGRPVVVHCSDGWDRTPQIVATAQLCLDPYYRTVEGFRVLVEREWLSFGHKFSDRSGNGPNSDELNERCPVFLQWLDLVHQIHRQFPCSFEFSIGYLIKLAQHSLSCLFGTFLCNSLKERIDNSVFDRTFSVWPFLSETMYRNPLYRHENEKVLWPAHNVRFLYFWSDVYLGSLGNKNGTDLPSIGNEQRQSDNIGSMTKTRSSGDLLSNELGQSNLSRRSSDPNLAAESNVTDFLNLNSNSMFDIRSETKESATHLNNESKKLENISKNSSSTSSDAEQNIITTQPQCDILELLNDTAVNQQSSNLRTDNKTSSDLKHNETNCDPPNPNNETPEDELDGNGFNDVKRNIEHDLVESTDTLISVDMTQQYKSNNAKPNYEGNDDIIGTATKADTMTSTVHNNTNKMSSQSYSNLPKVHVKPRGLRQLQMANNGSNYGCIWDSLPHHLDLHAAAAPSLRDREEHHLAKDICGSLPTAAMESHGINGNFLSLEPQRMDALAFHAHNNISSATINTCSALEIATLANQMRSNTLSSNSSRDNANLKYADNGSTPNIPAPGLNSLPPTPQGSQDRTQFAISCPDGLAHALSEQNIRLHQIVQEHKLREDVLLREIHGMRLALLHKACPSCNSVVSTNVEHENGLDIVENASTCSWEAVEERSGPSSYTTSSIQEKKAASVLWVPDHAVSRCSNCQIEFWLGRRKHHCRSCGEIFCADCSEFWAPLPYEKLFNPVRLCGSCYTAVTAHVQECLVPSDDCVVADEIAKPTPSSQE